MSERLEKNSIDTIVTEPYLGPIKIKNFKVKQVVRELSQLYIQAFKDFKKVLKKNGKVVIIFPVFQLKNKIVYLYILDEIKKIGFKIENLLPKKIQTTERNSLIYSRPGQKVLREIFKFTKS